MGTYGDYWYNIEYFQNCRKFSCTTLAYLILQLEDLGKKKNKY